jgi:hypothetical protein
MADQSRFIAAFAYGYLESNCKSRAKPNRAHDALRARRSYTYMSSRVVQIKSIVRPMRGGSQPHLVKGDNGRYYVAKFMGNPQGTRTLINEWIAASLFQKLSICTPNVRVLHLSQKLRDDAQLYFSIGSRNVLVESGLHFGSECPVNPDATAIFDFLPRKFLPQVVNLGDFAKALVIDKKLRNVDFRQAIFIRERRKFGGLLFRAHLIDHGMVFSGSRWQLQDAPSQGVHVDRNVYNPLDLQRICWETVDQANDLTAEDLRKATHDIPTSWFDQDDEASLHRLFSEVQLESADFRRRFSHHLHTLEADLRRGEPKIVPIRRPVSEYFTPKLVAPEVPEQVVN